MATKNGPFFQTYYQLDVLQDPGLITRFQIGTFLRILNWPLKQRSQMNSDFFALIDQFCNRTYIKLQKIALLGATK